uniref:Uncharacterized protein n=1 Tax=Siphoviridae sp. ct5co22 TaxID=2826294 RepID=A0A8S5QU30_9CAUD|nr:MAG TPA: hypothetical protein [Siphoviridae sp. ct5co22]
MKKERAQRWVRSFFLCQGQKRKTGQVCPYFFL